MQNRNDKNKGTTAAAEPAAEINKAEGTAGQQAEIAAAVDAVAAQQEPENLYHRLFESVHFEPKDSKVYDNSDGSQVKQIAQGIAVFRGGFAGVPVKVYARKAKGAKGAVAEVNFVSANRGSTPAIKALDTASEAQLNEFKLWMGGKFAEWRKKAGPAAQTAARATTVEVEGLDF